MSNKWSLEIELLRIILSLVEQTQPAVVVELGTYMGRTSAAIGLLLRECSSGHVFTIDDFRSVDAEHSKTLFREHRLEEVVTQIEKTTNDAFYDWGRTPIDVLLIDASHDYISSCVDFSLWSRLLCREGWIVIHDTKTRLLRRFPEDYVHPLPYYDVLEVLDLESSSRRRPWEGVAFVRHRDRALDSHDRSNLLSRTSHWAGALGR